MRMVFAAAAISVLSACTFAANTGGGQQSASGCTVTASTEWEINPNARMTVEAVSNGADCASAAAMITLRDENSIAWVEAYPVANVMVLAGAADRTAMQTALNEWISTANPAYATSRALPDWPQGADAPMSGDFMFYVVEGTTREQYLALRARDVPVYCYVQGMESMNCLALEDGILTSVGLQSFPG